MSMPRMTLYSASTMIGSMMWVMPMTTPVVL